LDEHERRRKKRYNKKKREEETRNRRRKLMKVARSCRRTLALNVILMFKTMQHEYVEKRKSHLPHLNKNFSMSSENCSTNMWA